MAKPTAANQQQQRHVEVRAQGGHACFLSHQPALHLACWDWDWLVSYNPCGSLFSFPASHFALILLQDWRRQCVNEIFTLLPLAGLGWIVMASNSAKWRHSWLYQTTSTGWLSRNAVMCRWSFERMRLQVLRFFSSSRHLEMKRRHFQVSEFKVPTSLTHAQALVTKISSSGYCGHRDCKQGTFHCSFES